MALSASERIARAQAALAVLAEVGSRAYTPSERLFQSLELRRGAAAATAPPAAPAAVDDDDDDVLACLPAYTNLYLLTRIRPVEHHVTMHVTLGDGSHNVEQFSGTPHRMQRATCIVRGPCCATSTHHATGSATGSAIESATGGRDRLSDAARAAVDAAARACACALPGSCVERVEYGGHYAECTLTEVMASPSCAPHALRAQLASDLSRMDASTSALQRLDVECMLAILDRPQHARAAAVAAARALPRRDAPLQAPPGVSDSALQVGHFMLRFDGEGRLVMPHAEPVDLDAVATLPNGVLAPSVAIDVASLHGMKLRAGSPWLDFKPASHGRLIAARVKRDAEPLDALLLPLLRTARDAWLACVAGVYSSPLAAELRRGTRLELAPEATRDASIYLEHKDARSLPVHTDRASPQSWIMPPSSYDDVREFVISIAPHGRRSKRMLQQCMHVPLNDVHALLVRAGAWPRSATVELKLAAPLECLHVCISVRVDAPPSVESGYQAVDVVLGVVVHAGEQVCGSAVSAVATPLQVWPTGVVTCINPSYLPAPLVADVRLPSTVMTAVGHEHVRMVVEEFVSARVDYAERARRLCVTLNV